MKSLVHIVWQMVPLECAYFITLTLPKALHRRSPKKQKEAMDRLIKHVASNYLLEARGCYEFTRKGNIHAHMLASVRPLFGGIKFDTPEEEHKAYETLLTVNIKQYVICDVQYAKNHCKVCEYITKDVLVTEKCLGSSAYFSVQDIVDNSDVKPLDVKETEKVNFNCLCIDDCCKDITIKM